MNELTYTIELLERILLKTKEGKIKWIEESQNLATVVFASPTKELSAIFRVAEANPFRAVWQRFILRQGGAELLQVFNPIAVRVASSSELDKAALPILQEIFTFVAVAPRERKLQKNLEQLDQL